MQVLFEGGHSPTGKLPIMFPLTEADAVPPEQGPEVRYTEGLLTSYRNPAFRAAFPFGHGLSYARWRFDRPSATRGCAGRDGSASRLCVDVNVTNVGGVAAATVAQLYVEFPKGLEPAPLLKGFEKTRRLAPGETAALRFALRPRDLSTYRVDAATAGRGTGWVLAPSVRLHVGTSSADIRASVEGDVATA